MLNQHEKGRRKKSKNGFCNLNFNLKISNTRGCNETDMMTNKNEQEIHFEINCCCGYEEVDDNDIATFVEQR